MKDQKQTFQSQKETESDDNHSENILKFRIPESPHNIGITQNQKQMNKYEFHIHPDFRLN